MGTPAPAAASLGKLIESGHEIAGVYTQPDRPSGRGNKIAFSPVKEVALRHGFPLFQPTKIRTPEALAEFRSLAADAAVVVAYGRILPDGFLSAFPQGAINLHFSLLPKYRGAAPVNWAIVQGETHTGVTTIRMDAGLDTGDILLQRETKILPDETAPELMERLSVVGADLLLATIRDLTNIKPVAQDDSEATFAPIMKRGDGLIDWNMSADRIANRVRGFQPFPGTFTFLHGRRVSVLAARAGSEASSDAPGTLLSTRDGQLAVAAGEGTTLEIAEIQFEGKKRMPVRDALNGSQFTFGDRFSSDDASGPTRAQ